MSWIIAAVAPKSGELPAKALAEFRHIGSALPCAPWKIESGDLRSGQERLEEITGRSWNDIALTADEVKAEYERLKAEEGLQDPKGITAVILAFFEVCARHGLAMEGGEGARVMRRSASR